MAELRAQEGIEVPTTGKFQLQAHACLSFFASLRTCSAPRESDEEDEEAAMAELRAQEGIEAPTTGKPLFKCLAACHPLHGCKGAGSRAGPKKFKTRSASRA